MAMNPRLLRPIAGGVHPEAGDWAARVAANGGTVGGATLKAVSNFCRTIDANGLRSLLWRVNPMAGDNLSAVLVPLFRSDVALGVQGNTTDGNDNFVSGDYTATSGLVGNGSNKRLLTGLPVNFSTSRHVGCFVSSLSSNTFRVYMGATGASTFAGRLTLEAGSPATALTLSTNSEASGAGGSSNGTHAAGDFVLGTTNGLGGPVLGGLTAAYANGVATVIGTTAQNSGTVSTPISIFARANADGSFSEHINARIGGYSIGNFMTASQALSYYNIWDTLLRALGRK